MRDYLTDFWMHVVFQAKMCCTVRLIMFFNLRWHRTRAAEDLPEVKGAGQVRAESISEHYDLAGQINLLESAVACVHCT
jgi:hypothetical protein